jgi:hypothetical protein
MRCCCCCWRSCWLLAAGELACLAACLLAAGCRGRQRQAGLRAVGTARSGVPPIVSVVGRRTTPSGWAGATTDALSA